MPTLGAKERAGLPDRAFAYIDSQGGRRLPIHDEAHVRNALARFGRVSFEDEAGRDRARMRLLKAAKKFGIMPLGFVGVELRPDKKLPRGHVTFALTDIEGSTELLQRLGDGYDALLSQLRRLQRTAVRQAGGREVDARGDEFFAAFERSAPPTSPTTFLRLGPSPWRCRASTVPAGHAGRPRRTGVRSRLDGQRSALINLAARPLRRSRDHRS